MTEGYKETYVSYKRGSAVVECQWPSVPSIAMMRVNGGRLDPKVGFDTSLPVCIHGTHWTFIPSEKPVERAQARSSGLSGCNPGPIRV